MHAALRTGYAPPPTAQFLAEVAANLAQGLGCGPDEARRLARAHARTMYRSGVLWYALRLASRGDISQFLAERVETRHADRLLDAARGPVIPFTAHFGLPVVAGLRMGQLLAGHTTLHTFFASPEDNPSTAGYQEVFARSGLGIDCILVSARASLAAMRVLKRGEALAMQPDVFDNRQGQAVVVPFLRGLTYAMTGTAFLALRAGATLLPLRADVTDRGRVIVDFDEPLRYEPVGDAERDAWRLTALVQRAIERHIHDAPDQWIYWQVLGERMVPGATITPAELGSDAAWAAAFRATARWASSARGSLAPILREAVGPAAAPAGSPGSLPPAPSLPCGAPVPTL